MRAAAETVPQVQPRWSAVTVTLTAPRLVSGQTTEASATLLDASGNAVTDRTIAWSSSNAAVATVSGSGARVTITAVAPGTATITATSEARSGTATLDVVVRIATLQLALGATSVTTGQTTTATAIPRDAQGNALTGRTIVWTSSAPTIATISGSGGSATITAVAPGATTITATSEGVSQTATLTVTAGVASVTLTLTTPLFPGQTTTAAATLVDAQGNVLTGRPIVWSSSSPTVATVSGTGQQVTLTAVAPGSTTISAASEGRNASVVLTVLARVASVTVSLTAVHLGLGETTTAIATLRDAQGNTLTGRSVTWTSNDPTVATVTGSGANGTVTASALGTTQFIATSEGVTGSSATLLVTTAPPFVQVDAGASHTCARANTGVAYCWGEERGRASW